MPTPHKHAAAIKAYADGHKIQHRNPPSNVWIDWTGNLSPTFSDLIAYRVKPDVLRYRVGLYYSDVEKKPSLFVVKDNEGRFSWEKYNSFIRWVTEWVEVEV